MADWPTRKPTRLRTYDYRRPGVTALPVAGVALDVSVVMPNHVHGIISLLGVDLRLGEIVAAFKSLTTVEFVRGVRERGWPAFPGHLCRPCEFV